MLRKVLLLTLILSLAFGSVLLAKRGPAKARSDLGPSAISIDQIERPFMESTNGVDFKKYVITGTVLGTSTLEFATAYFGRSIAVGRDGVVHAVWCTEGDPSNEVIYVRSVDHGKTWSEPAELVPSFYYHYKPSIAIDPNDPQKVYVAHVSYPDEGGTRTIYVSASTDEGLSWGDPVGVFGSVLDCNNPYIIVDYRGWVHVAFDNYTDSYTRYNYSADGGKTWLGEPMVATVGFADDTFAATLAIDYNNNVHVLTGGGGTFGSWGDKGVYWTWLDMSAVSPGDLPFPVELPPVELAPPGTGMPYPCMVFDSKNVGHLFYDNAASADETNNNWRSVYYRKYEGGTWLDPEHIPSLRGGGNGGTTCAIDQYDNLYVCFHDLLDGDAGWDWNVWPVDLVSGTNASGEWQFVNITGDGPDVNQQYADCADWVAEDSILHVIYTATAAAPHDIVYEVGYPWPPEPKCGVAGLPDTYNTSGPFTIRATTTDIDGEVVGCKIHVWQNDTKIVDGEEMTQVEKDNYEYILNITGSPGDKITYQGEARDNDEYTGISLIADFNVLAPENPDADILIVRDDGRASTFHQQLWDATLRPGSYETWDVDTHDGIDASVTMHGWNTILIHGWVISTVPTRGYEGDPFAEFLQAGTTDTPKNLLLASMDYFFGAGEPGSPEELAFEAGDFAYDFFGIASGTSDPGQDQDSLLLGTAGDPISDPFADTALELRPDLAQDDDGGAIANWIDWTGAIEYDNDIFIAANEGFGSGVKYDAGTFKTIHLPWMLCHLVKDTLNTPQDEAVVLMNNIFTWFGTNTAVDDQEVAVVTQYDLAQNYPNPFNPVTHIDYSVPKTVNVELTVYNSLGQKVKSLVNKKVAAGHHQVAWDGTNAAGQLVTSGTYFYQIKAGDFVKVNKMVFLK